MAISIKTAEEIELMRESGRRLAALLASLKSRARAGVTTRELDDFARETILQGGDTPAFLNYRPSGADKPYPFTLCASLNDTVVHGLPSDQPLADGDVLKLDLGLVHQGFYSDAAITVPIGTPDPVVTRLIDATREALQAGIRQSRLGNTLGDIGAAVFEVISRAGFSVVDSLTGHGIGRRLHEDPYVFNFGQSGKGEPLKEGMVIAIEPMVSAQDTRGRRSPLAKVVQRRDDSFATADGSLTAHFEHTVAITRRGPEVLTALQ